MSCDPSWDGADCVELALAFARSPSRFPDLLHGRQPLPPGVTALLQLAAGNPLSTLDTSEQQQAARFFIEEVLLAHHADHYRVLGVAPMASAEQIKEHHRLLIRLFHPDRQPLPDTRTDAFATRINQAYNVLRSAETRAAYDRMVMEKHGAVPPPAKRYSRQPHFVHALDFPMDPPSFVRRHRTLFAVGGVALAATIGVFLTTLNQVPTGAIGASGNQFTHSSDTGASLTAPPVLPPAVVRALAEPPPVQSAPHDVPPVFNDTPHESTSPVTTHRRMPDPAAISPTVKATAIMLVPPAKAIPASIPEPLPSPMQANEATPSSAGERPASIPTAVPEIKSEPLRLDLLNQLISSFTEQYKRGDLENLLVLFDASARIERGDKNQIRTEYGELFRSSESRILHIWDMAWSSDGRITRGEGSFQARVLQKGEPTHRIYNGLVTVEVIQRDNRPLISSLYHRVISN